MKKISLFLGLLITFNLTFGQTHKIIFRLDKSQIKYLPAYISVDNYKNDTVIAFVHEKNWKKLKKSGLKYKEIPLNRRKTIDMATTVDDMAGWDKYPTYGVYVQMMENYATTYPDICKLDTIGVSQNGRLLLVLRITDFPDSIEAEPQFFYTSTMHGDETAGYLFMLRLIDTLLSSYGSNSEITDLIDNFDIYINPLANPDGTYNGGDDDISNAQRYLANGDDPNRSFPSQSDNSPVYTGSDPEIKAMVDFANSHNIVVSANFHGGSEVYNFPWDYWTSSENTHADDAWFRYVGSQFVSDARQINSSYMTDVTSSGIIEGGDWYAISGGRQDFMTYYEHCREVTIELSSTKLLPNSDLNRYWNYLRTAFINYIKTSKQGFWGIVKNENGEPLEAKIEITGHDKDNSWVVTNKVTGAYFRPIEPGTYNVTYTADGYQTETKTVTVDSWDSSVEENVVMSPYVSNIKDSNLLKVYPNPVRNFLHIETNGESVVKILTITGKEILQKNIQANDFIDVSNLPKGIYLLQINREGNVKTIKFAKF